MTEHSGTPIEPQHNFTNRIVKIFLESNLSIILILLAAVVGLAALGLTPREEDPQIVVPLADVYVNFPGHSAAEVEQLVTTPLEKMLYQIDGVEYVYSMSRENQAIITVRFYVGRGPRAEPGEALQRRSTRTSTSFRRASAGGWSSRWRSTTCRSSRSRWPGARRRHDPPPRRPRR